MVYEIYHIQLMQFSDQSINLSKSSQAMARLGLQPRVVHYVGMRVTPSHPGVAPPIPIKTCPSHPQNLESPHQEIGLPSP